MSTDEPVHLAHIPSEKARTDDVELDESITFPSMMLRPEVEAGLKICGYVYPSPIQVKGIPLGRCGYDLLLQAKSGTGKTLVFSIIILERLKENESFPQCLIITPTREMAYQVTNILKSLGQKIRGLRVVTCIGGLSDQSVNDDRQRIQKATIIVATPGRLDHLIRNKFINPSAIHMVVLDEADSLFSGTHKPIVVGILRTVSDGRQLIAASATYTDGIDREILKYMKNPICVTPKREAPVLKGVRQLFSKCISDETAHNSLREMFTKLDRVHKIFTTIPFKQCLLFSNSQSRAESYSNYLTNLGWQTKSINGSMEQVDRLKVFNEFRSFRINVLCSTDLMARGIDAENVDLVINLDVPRDACTYLHRIGRCGRFGSYGIAITLLSSEQDQQMFKTLLNAIGGNLEFVEELDFEHILSEQKSGVTPMELQKGLLKVLFDDGPTPTIDRTLFDNFDMSMAKKSTVNEVSIQENPIKQQLERETVLTPTSIEPNEYECRTILSAIKNLNLYPDENNLINLPNSENEKLCKVDKNTEPSANGHETNEIEHVRIQRSEKSSESSVINLVTPNKSDSILSDKENVIHNHDKDNVTVIPQTNFERKKLNSVDKNSKTNVSNGSNEMEQEAIKTPTNSSVSSESSEYNSDENPSSSDETINIVRPQKVVRKHRTGTMENRCDIRPLQQQWLHRWNNIYTEQYSCIIDYVRYARKRNV